MRTRFAFAIACLVAAVAPGTLSGQSDGPAEAPKADPGVELPGHTYEVTGLAFSPDGGRIVSSSLSGVRIWNPATGKEIKPLRQDAGYACAFSPDGKRFAIAGFTDITIYDAESFRKVLSVVPHGDWDRNYPFPPTATALAFSPDGRQLAMSASVAEIGGRHGYPGGVVKIWDAQTGRLKRTFDGLSTRAESVAFSPDGSLIAAGTTGAGTEIPEPGELIIWEVESGNRLHTLRIKEKIPQGANRLSASGVAFSPDGRRLASASSDGTVRIWDVRTGRLVRTLSGHRREIQRVAFSPDGKRLASAGHDRTVRLWDVATGEAVGTFAFDTPRISALAFSPDGNRLAAGGGELDKSGAAKVWKLTGKADRP